MIDIYIYTMFVYKAIIPNWLYNLSCLWYGSVKSTLMRISHYYYCVGIPCVSVHNGILSECLEIRRCLDIYLGTDRISQLS